MRIAERPLIAFTGHQGYGDRLVTYHPRKYHESWHQRACGESVKWRGLDDADDKRYQEVTAILLKRR